MRATREGPRDKSELTLPEDAIIIGCTYGVLEGLALLEGQAVCLRDDRYDIDYITQLLHHDDVYRLQAVSRRADEVEAAVDAGVHDVSVPHRGELFAKVSRVLVFDVFDDGVPAMIFMFVSESDLSSFTVRLAGILHSPPIIVDHVSKAGRIDDVQAQLHLVLLND